MEVIKRNGSSEEVSFDKIKLRISKMANLEPKLENVDPIEIAQKVIARIYDKIKTDELDEETASICTSLITKHPDYSFLGSRIIISNNQKNTNMSFQEKLELLNQIPSRWEKLGDMLLIPENSFNSDTWKEILPILDKEIWKIFCQVLGVSKIGRQKKIRSGPMRKSQVELLFGESGVVCHKENSIIFEFDTTKVMFSSGNVSERIRISNFDCSDEIVLDLYAGIGYYTLPLLVHANVKLLYACEMNPDSICFLKKNLIHNGVSEKCIINEGNNSSILSNPNIIGEVNRVMLGLLPSSRDGWGLAIQALNPKGGILHLHGNCL